MRELKKVKIYWDNGNLQEICYVDEKGDKQGKYIRYWENGNLRMKGNFKNNTDYGKCAVYRVNGLFDYADYWYYDMPISKKEFFKRLIYDKFK